MFHIFLFCLVIALSCNNNTKNMIKKKLEFNLLLRSTTSSTIFLWWHYETFHLNKKFIFKLEKNYMGTCWYWLRKIYVEADWEPCQTCQNYELVWNRWFLSTNSNNIKKKKKIDLNTCQDSIIAYYLMLALLIVNLFQSLNVHK